MSPLAAISRAFGGTVAPVSPAQRYRVAIVGGGSAGVSVAGLLLRKLGFPKGEIAIVEPRDEHFYMPKWTMVGGLGLDVKTTSRPMGSVLPPGVDWVKERCSTFDPQNCKIVLGNGQALEYDVLVVAAGLQQNFDKIPGLAETMGKNGVASIYSYEYSPLVWRNIQEANGGIALFTNPATPVNCGGAPQKICYLAEHAWRNRGVREKFEIQYATATASIFTNPFYSAALEPLMVSKGIKPLKKCNLVEVDGTKKVALFEREDGEIYHQSFDFMHVTPPMSAPSFLEASGLLNQAGFVDVDKETCQHVKYPNIFALGDCSSLPTSKTYSAITGQAPVVVHNIQAALQNRPATGAYDGYTACPVLTGDSKLMLAEFNGYSMEPEPTFWPLDQRKPTWPFFLMKRYAFEQSYWHFAPIGRWFGKRTFFEPSVKAKKAGSAHDMEVNVSSVQPELRASLQGEMELPSAARGTSHGVPGEAGAVKPMLFGVETPAVPGNISLSGSLPPEAVKALAPRYKGWLYLNPADHPDFHRKEIEEAGCQLENVHLPGGFSGGKPTPEHAKQIVEAMRRLPRPLMLQCTSGNRSGAALVLWLAKKAGRSVDVATQLAEDLQLKYTKCISCDTLREWLAEEIKDLPRGFALAEETGFTLEQLFDTQGSSTFTYLVGCNDKKEAILIDPVLGNEERDLSMVDERGLKLKYVVNTHCHADHVTSGSAIKKLRPEVKTVISKASGAKADIHLSDNDVIKFGEYSIEALATPGHTDGCMCFVLRGPGNPLVVFTGDAVLIRGCGRTDFQQGSSDLLYDNVHKRIFTLPNSTKIYPGHDYKGRNLSTVREEKNFNPRLTKSKEEFASIMAGLNLPHPKLIDTALPANLKDGEV